MRRGRGTGALGAGMVAVLLMSGSLAGVATAAPAEPAAHGAFRAVEDDPFYDPPSPLPTHPGTLLRVESLGVDVPGGEGLRILYVSQRPDGTPVASSGMVFIPDTPAPEGGRHVVAWAHPTVGLGDTCAPSRRPNPLKTIASWLEPMMQRGWVVTATDYAGLGTPGPSLYLDGQAEARDVVYSVRAARQIETAHAGSEFIVWGHSQGGHSALWTGTLAHSLAPELHLTAVAAAAPAAELNDIMGAQWDTAVAWVIGPEVMLSWPQVYPHEDFSSVLSPVARLTSRSVARLCIDDAAIAGLLAKYANIPYFSSDPTQNAAWQDAGAQQTPSHLPGSLPMMLVQSTTDQVVLAWPNAKLQDEWCAAGSNITAEWLSGIGHMKTASDSGPSVVTWIAERFLGRPNASTCNVPPPIEPHP